MCTGHLHRIGIFRVAANQIMIGEIDTMATVWHACRNQLRDRLRPADHSGGACGGMRTIYSQPFDLCNHPPSAAPIAGELVSMTKRYQE